MITIIEGFVEKLLEMIPSLEDHRCSEGVKGGGYAHYPGWPCTVQCSEWSIIKSISSPH